MHTQFYFTATPKSETLQTHGVRAEDENGVFFRPFDVHTQDEAVSQVVAKPKTHMARNLAVVRKADVCATASLSRYGLQREMGMLRIHVDVITFLGTCRKAIYPSLRLARPYSFENDARVNG